MKKTRSYAMRTVALVQRVLFDGATNTALLMDATTGVVITVYNNVSIQNKLSSGRWTGGGW